MNACFLLPIYEEVLVEWELQLVVISSENPKAPNQNTVWGNTKKTNKQRWTKNLYG